MQCRLSGHRASFRRCRWHFRLATSPAWLAEAFGCTSSSWVACLACLVFKFPHAVINQRLSLNYKTAASVAAAHAAIRDRLAAKLILYCVALYIATKSTASVVDCVCVSPTHSWWSQRSQPSHCMLACSPVQSWKQTLHSAGICNNLQKPVIHDTWKELVLDIQLGETQLFRPRA